jgi:hypothetical protein
MISGAVIALIALAAVAVAYTYAYDGTVSAPGENRQPPVSATPAVHVAGQHTEQHGGRIDPATISLQKQISVPKKGTFVVVRYPGAYTGTYQADNKSVDVQNSGDTLYSIENGVLTVSGSFKKADRSAKQTLTVEIWKDGKILTSKSTQDLFGEVRISSRIS